MSAERAWMTLPRQERERLMLLLSVKASPELVLMPVLPVIVTVIFQVAI